MRRAGAVAVMACVLLGVAGTMPVAAAPGVAVVMGDHYGTRIFPDDAFTVADATELSGRHVHLRLGVDYPTVNGTVRSGCDTTDYSLCDAFAQLNQLDGFDLQPRVTVPLTGAINLASVDDSNFYITDAAGAAVSGLRQLTLDPATFTLAGISDRFLVEDTTYAIHVTAGIRDTTGNPIAACGGTCVVPFTTRSAATDLVNIRRSMDLPAGDPNNAYVAAGIPGAATSPAARKATFVQNGVADVFPAASVLPSIANPLNGIVRTDQQRVNLADPMAFHPSVVPNLILPGSAGYYAFGSFLSPRYQFASATGHQDNPYGVGDGHTDGEIPPVPTTTTPAPLGYDRLGVIVVTPNPLLHPPPWPAAVYGPGFTRSDFDIFVTADYNASLGIVTVATDPAGHGFGAQSTITVTSAGTPTTFLSYGRGRDLDGDGVIGSGLNDGVGTTAHQQPGGALPSHKPLDGVASGLVQSAADNMALGRSLVAGLDIPGVGTGLVDPTHVMYYGLSFGGIYGTMVMGTDPLFHQGLLNVPGGPIADIARLSSFRTDLAATLKVARPTLLNGGPGNDGFTEDLPLRNDPPEVIQHTGAAQLQELFGETDWYDRYGSPETFAPRIRLRPDPAWAGNPKNIAFQSAYGDGTVPNPAAGTLYRAGQLFDRVVYYRNDKTPTYASDPHGWLADPTLAGRTSGEQQVGLFLATGTLVPTNPVVLETTVVNPNNFECLHYPDPQTGQAQVRQPFPFSGDCPAAPSHGVLPAASAGTSSTPPVTPAPALEGTAGTGLVNTARGAPDSAAAALSAAGLVLLVAAGRRRRPHRRGATADG